MNNIQVRPPYSNELYHHGVKGQRWGVRRYQRPDGTLTKAGEKRYHKRLVEKAVQGVYNKICQLELDAKNDKISELQAQLAQARNDASQNAQTQALIADNLRQTQALEQYLNPAPIPAYVVQNPNCCNSNYYASCGCSAR